MNDFPSFDCTGAVIGGHWSLLEVVEYGGRTRSQNRHQWLLRCLTCGLCVMRKHVAVMGHKYRDGNPTIYCPACRWRARNPNSEEVTHD